MSTLTETNSAEARLREYEQADQLAQRHLATFDDLDYNVFSNQDWVRLHESHSDDVLVHWPDGHTTRGLKRHIDDLGAMFVYAPDTRIKQHPVKIAHGEWTSVIGVMEGTFSKPMPIGDGKSIPPTGKRFALGMVTIGHWGPNGRMDHEWLFWDSQDFMKQLGLAK